MAVEAWDIIFLGSATMPEDDTTTTIGGAIAPEKKMTFALLDTTGVLQCVSEAGGDTTQNLTITGRLADGSKDTEVLLLNGTTEVTGSKSFSRIMKVEKTAACAGDVAVFETTPEHSGTAQAGASNEITLASGASASDNAYQFKVLYIKAGTGSGQVREVIKYTGSSKKAYVRDWTVEPDATSVYEICNGVVMERFGGGANEIDEVRRVFYDAAANAAGGSDKDIYEKIFVKNIHATLALTNAKIDEVDEGGYAKVDFALETTLDGTGTNGANTRLVAPSSGVGSFDDAQKDVANSGNLSPGAAQGVWFHLDANAGDAATNTFYKLETSGQST